jgi:hypothetical protein
VASARGVVAFALACATGLVACAQLQGLGDYSKVDCLADCADAFAPDTGPAPPPGEAGADAPSPTCPPCAAPTPFCDSASLRCVECLPGQNACPVGQYCDPDPAVGYKCTQGCATVADCVAAAQADAGADAQRDGEAGVADAAAGDGGDAGATTLACCNNRCVDTINDSRHCGACNNACNTSSECCSGTCTDVVSTTSSCGGCGRVCSSNHVPSPTCGARACAGACEPGWGDCNANKLTDGCETDIFTNPQRCGTCTTVCSNNHIASPTCGGGSCNGACDNGWGDCNNNKQTDGCEIDIANTAMHCGACGSSCSNANITTPTCSGGNCNGVCNSGYADCDSNKRFNGCETNINTSTGNCGACGRACSNNNITTPTCAAGVCNAACNTGFADCNNNKQTDGCEENIYTNPSRCGTCTNVCSGNHIATPTCAAGVCNGTCDSGWRDCDNNKLTNGCETNVSIDTAHCNACNNACPAGMRNCVGGTCTPGYGVTTSPQGFIDACAQVGMTRYFTTPGLDDDAVGPLTLPFTFTYYGAAQTQVWFSTNGVLGFGATPSTEYFFNCLPDAGNPQNAIYGYALDLDNRATGTCVATVGTAPNRRYAVTWSDALHLGDPSTHATFSIVLNEGTNTIDLSYQTLTSIDGSAAVIGIQGTGTPPPATEYSCFVAGLTTATRLRFIP